MPISANTLSSAEAYAEFPETLKMLIETGRVKGISREIGTLTASTLNNLYILQSLFRATDAKQTLEIGLATGASALVLLGEHRRAGYESGHHTAIDPFQMTFDFSAIVQIKAERLEDRFTHLTAPSNLALPELIRAEEKFDLIYIDGSHAFVSVIIDAIYSMSLLNKGGVLAFDDSAKPGVKAAIKIMRQQFTQHLEEIDTLPYRPVDTRSLKFKLSKLLGKRQLTAFRRTGTRTEIDPSNYSLNLPSE